MTRRRVRLIGGLTLFLWAELVLFGAAEGYNKWSWITVGTTPNLLLAVGFCVL